MSKKVQVTKAINHGGKRYFPGDIAEGEAGQFIIDQKCGRPAPVEPSENKASKPPKTKG